MPSFTALAVLFSDCQKSGLVALLTENQRSSVKTRSTLLTLSLYTVLQYYTVLYYSSQTLYLADKCLMSLVSLTHIWCHWHNFSVSNKSEVFLTALWWLWHFSGDSDTPVLSPKCLVSLTHVWCRWHVSDVPTRLEETIKLTYVKQHDVALGLHLKHAQQACFEVFVVWDEKTQIRKLLNTLCSPSIIGKRKKKLLIEWSVYNNSK